MGVTLWAEQSANSRGLTLAEMAELVEEACKHATERGVPTDQIIFGRCRTGLKAQLRRVEVHIP